MFPCAQVVLCVVCYQAVISCFFFSFYSPYVMLALNCPINSFKILIRETGVVDYYN